SLATLAGSALSASLEAGAVNAPARGDWNSLNRVVVQNSKDSCQQNGPDFSGLFCRKNPVRNLFLFHAPARRSGDVLDLRPPRGCKSNTGVRRSKWNIIIQGDSLRTIGLFCGFN